MLFQVIWLYVSILSARGPPHASEVKGASVALLIYKKTDLIWQVDFYVKTYRRRYFAMVEM